MVAPLLAYLRTLQRDHHLAVALVHHARKAAAHARPGQALRGSSEFHAWGDSNLYLRRHADQLLRLTIEHRAARAPDDVLLALHTDNDVLALRVVDSRANACAPPRADTTELIAQTLAAAAGPLTVRQLRAACRMRTDTICKTLDALTSAGRVLKSHHGFRLAP